MKILKSISVILALLVLAFGGIYLKENYRSFFAQEESIEIDYKLNYELLAKSLELGSGFLLNNQRAEGNFNYEYDFISKKISADDNQVRQAGALWGIALIHQENPSAKAREAIIKGLKFFENISKENSLGKFPVYQSEASGKTGTVALIVLTLNDFIEAEKNATNIDLDFYKSERKKYLKFLLSLRQENGQFYGAYDYATGKGIGAPSPYFDGESLLALAKYANYEKDEKILDLAIKSADAMYQKNVVEALDTNSDSDTTKGFYQWGTMSFYQLYINPDTKNHKRFAERAIDLAYWMIDTHKILTRTRNTAYAYEGLIHATELARLERQKDAQIYFTEAIDRGLYALSKWQVGSELQNDFLQQNPTTDPLAVGGIINEDDLPGLRIDVTQHQMHAVMLAQKFIYQNVHQDPRKNTQISKELALKSAELAGQYLINATRPDGQFDYSYDAKKDTIANDYNMLRHAGTIFSMIQLYELTEDQALLKAAEKAIGYLEKQIDDCGLNGIKGKCLIENGYVKLGGNALAIIALTEYSKVLKSDKYLPLAQGLATWITASQSKAGEFLIHKLSYSTQKIDSFISDYYPGEALFSLALLYEVDGNKKWLDAAEKGADWLINTRDKGKTEREIEHDHWLLYALEAIYRNSPNKDYLNHSLLIAHAIIKAQLLSSENPQYIGGYYDPPRSTPTAVRSEGLLATYRLLKNTDDKDFEPEMQQILKTVLLSFEFELRTQINNDQAKNYPNPQKALGGFKESLDGSEIRIDYVQHNLSALISYLTLP